MIDILNDYNENCVYDNARQKISHRDMVDYVRHTTMIHYYNEYIKYLQDKMYEFGGENNG